MGKFLSSISSVISLEPKSAHMDLSAWKNGLVKGDPTTTSFFTHQDEIVRMMNNSFISTLISEEDLILLYENTNFNANIWQEDEDYNDTVSVLPTPIMAQEEVLAITFPSEEFVEIVHLDSSTDRTTLWTRMWSRLKRLLRCVAK